MGQQLKLNLQIIIMRGNEIHKCKEEGGTEGWMGNRKGDGEDDSRATEAEGRKGERVTKNMGKEEGKERFFYFPLICLGATPLSNTNQRERRVF